MRRSAGRRARDDPTRPSVDLPATTCTRRPTTRRPSRSPDDRDRRRACSPSSGRPSIDRDRRRMRVGSAAGARARRRRRRADPASRRCPTGTDPRRVAAAGIATARAGPCEYEPHDPPRAPAAVAPEGFWRELRLRHHASPASTSATRAGTRPRKALDARIAAPLDGGTALRAGAQPQGRRRRDHGHDPARHGPGRCPRRPRHRRRREPRPRHARRARQRADHARACATWSSSAPRLRRLRRHLGARRARRHPPRRARLRHRPDRPRPFDDDDYHDVADVAAARSTRRADRRRHGHRAPVMRATLAARRSAGHRLRRQRSTRRGSRPRRSRWLEANELRRAGAQRGRRAQHRPPRAPRYDEPRRDRGALPRARARGRAHPVRRGARRRRRRCASAPCTPTPATAARDLARPGRWTALPGDPRERSAA